MGSIGKFLVVALVALMTLRSSAMAVELYWSVYDKKTDKKLLDIDGHFVENASGKRIMYFDGNRIENADGAPLLNFDKDTSIGFSIRAPKDPSVRLLWSDGKQICKQVDEGVVFEYDSNNRTIAL